MRFRRFSTVCAVFGAVAAAVVAVPATAQAAVGSCSSTWITEGGYNVGARGACHSGTGTFKTVIQCAWKGYEYTKEGNLGSRTVSGTTARVTFSIAKCVPGEYAFRKSVAA
ncbi:hypothetical protein ACXIZN_15685 [Amycolatopsis sp. TRM77291]